MATSGRPTGAALDSERLEGAAFAHSVASLFASTFAAPSQDDSASFERALQPRTATV